MIESHNTNELQGQYELDDLLPRNETPPMPDGYDAEGNLMNVDDLPATETMVKGTLGTFSATDDGSPKESLPPVGKVDFPENACIVPGKTDEVPDAPLPASAIADAATDTATADLSPQTSADVARLTTLATEIKTITEQTRATVISAALAVGKRLIEAKSICPAGRWLEWLETAVAYSERKAQDMMRLYMEYGRDGSIPDSIAALDYSKVVLLLSAPAEARQALAEKAADEDLSVRELQAEIKRLKAEMLKAQMQIEGLEKQVDTAQGHIEQLTDEGNRQDQAIVDRDREIKAKEAELKETKRVLADAAEKVSVAEAKTAAAESAAEQLKRLRAEAEERADQNAQRYGDALKRANDTAKELAEAKAKIQALSEAAAASATPPEVQTVEVVPESVRRELDQLRRDLAEARALQKPSPSGEGGPRSGTDEVVPPNVQPTATDRFKWFYSNQMKPTFTTALNLRKEVAQEDGHAADAFATALTNACKVLMNQLGVNES